MVAYWHFHETNFFKFKICVLATFVLYIALYYLAIIALVEFVHGIILLVSISSLH